MPVERRVDVRGRLGCNDDSGHKLSLGRVLLQELRTNLAPRASGQRLATMGFQTFLHQLAMPVGNRHFVMVKHRIPLRLDVVDLLVD